MDASDLYSNSDYSQSKQQLNIANSNDTSMAMSSLDKDLDNLKVTKSEAPMVSMVFSRAFILIYIMNFLSVATGYFAVNNFK